MGVGAADTEETRLFFTIDICDLVYKALDFFNSRNCADLHKEPS